MTIIMLNKEERKELNIFFAVSCGIPILILIGGIALHNAYSLLVAATFSISVVMILILTLLFKITLLLNKLIKLGE